MFFIFEKAVFGMAILRLLSGTIEVTAAILMLKFNSIDKAIIINSSLSLIGPLVLILTTTIGLVGIVDKVSFTKIVWIFLGVGLIFYGVRS
ncbi:YqhV family protein [Heyndrickxia ginsengihumi]|uniref:Membrane protein n=1 Tax=Heyndrickxia ginsengihumi TaxID=363870 RepID=A0A0A6Y197_9BACI|nr:YqhV family protein [Heyndrickxia ginsengihumi]KHD86077.1 membrane protein [Heyndrickxia ginsengihumi]MCM3023506.1 YqhV family protein [Heyndrickxia ginsengihumi]NEY20338.1 YqhV family protein [Heyndrickxia ginsengihumi]